MEVFLDWILLQILFFNSVCLSLLSCLWMFSGYILSDSFATPWTVACQAFLCMGFLKQEYWSWLPFSSLQDLPDPGIEPVSPAWQAVSLPLHCTTWEYHSCVHLIVIKTAGRCTHW